MGRRRPNTGSRGGKFSAQAGAQRLVNPITAAQAVEVEGGAAVNIDFIIDLLCTKYPKAFFRFEQRRQPLKIGVHLDLIASIPDVPEKDLRAALRVYTANGIYRRRLYQIPLIRTRGPIGAVRWT